MKRYISIIMLIVLIMTGTAYSNGDLQRMETISIDVFETTSELYHSNTVPIVYLMFGKEDILTTDVPAFILENRTLVPIRFIAETLDAEVDWNQDTRQAIINKDGKEIILTIDSAYALVNGKEVQLPSGVPAKLVTYQGSARTVVPFRFVSEQLGMEIEWVPDTYTAVIDHPHRSIVDVKYTTYEGLPAIAIDANGKVNYSAMYLPAIKLGMTDQLVIDIPNADLGDKDFYNKDVYENGIMDFRASLFERYPRETVRVTVELEMESTYETHYDEMTDTIYLTFNNEVKEIDYEKNSQAIVIKTEETPAINVIDMGDKVAVDILDAVLDDVGTDPITVDNDVVKQIRYSQYDLDYPGYDKVTRVVFDLQPGVSFADNMYIEPINNNVIAYMTSDPLNQFKYENKTLNDSILTLELNGDSKSIIKNDDVNKLITIQVDKEEIELIDEAKLEYYDDIIKYIQIDGESDRGYYLLSVKYDSDTTAKIIEGNTVSDRVAIEFTTKQNNIYNNLLYSDILVVLDPGHGGKDSGAYVNGVAEKTLNLDTSLKLKDLLEEAGFKVAMTRTNDSYPGLYERAALANALKADLYLSIHHNALPTKPDARGVLTLYDGSKIQSKTIFAKTIQREMVRGLQAPDKGLMNKPQYIVTRETNMTSALAELGFMTNPSELNLLTQDYYRQKCAQALFNGIKAYADEQLLK